jgi:hypothetical protein
MSKRIILAIFIFFNIFLTSCSNNRIEKNDYSKIYQEIESDQTQNQNNKIDEDFLQTPQNSFNLLDSRDLKTDYFNKQKSKIAILVPITGNHQELGKSILQSATLSLFDNDEKHNLELAIFNAGENDEELKKSFREIVKQNIKIVIGPIFSSSVEAIRKTALENNIIVISLSNNQQLINKNDKYSNIFIAGILPEGQVEKIVSFAVSQNKNSFAVIAPNNNYGKIITDYTKKFVKDRDAEFIISEFYSSNSDFSSIARRVVNAFKIDSSLSIASKNKTGKNYILKESDKIYPQIIFIPEAGEVGAKIISELKKQNKDERDFIIIGSSEWDNLSTISSPIMQGSLIASIENENFKIFEKSYYQYFQKIPPRISSIAYDMVAVIADLTEKNNDKLPDLKMLTSQDLWAKNGFEGIDGLFRFLPNGIVERNFMIFLIERGSLKVIDKSAEKFLKY